MKKLLSAAACAIALSGCVSVEHVPMTAATADTLKGRDISLSERAKPDFAAMRALTSGILVGGLLGAAVNISAGNQLIQAHNVPDPAEQIGAELRNALALKYGATAKAPRTALSSDEPAEAAKAAAGGDLVLDVRTINWMFAYFPTNWNRYRVLYSARTRLIDAKKGQVVAEAGCAIPPAENTDSAPTYDELVADDAARLKKELAKAAEHCAGEFANKMFSLDLAQYRAPAQPAPPASTAAAAPAPVAPAAPAAVAVRTTALPPAGSVWRYSMRDRVYSNRNRDFSVQLARVDAWNVTEVVSSDGQQEMHTADARDLSFYQRRMAGESVLELAPYLLAHVPKPQVPLGTPAAYPSGGLAQPWELRVTDVRAETVSVPAGRYEAVRIGVTGENPAAQAASAAQYGSSSLIGQDFRTFRFEFTVWYVPQLGRYVQARHRMINRLGNDIGDELIQLTKFEPGSTAPQAKGQ